MGRIAKILYAASTMEHINNFHLEIIDALRDRGDGVIVMARGVGADFDIPFEKRLISLVNIKIIFKIRKILKRERFDTLILNTTLAAFLIRLAIPKRLKKTTKVINFVHGYLFSPKCGILKRAFFLLCEKLVCKKCDTVITMNSYDEYMAKRYRLARERVIGTRGVGIRRRGVITPPERIREELGLSEGLVITFVGELSRRKNQAFLIRCLTKIRERLGEVRLCLVGEGGERERLSRLAERFSVADAVIFTGYRADAMDFIRLCDLYASASLVEGMPLNVIEAMSIGKTVLASRIKGHTDLITDGDDGYLYEIGDEGEFVDLACRILSGELPGNGRGKKVPDGYDRSSAAATILKILTDGA